MNSSEALLRGQEISVPIWEFGPQWMKSPRPASRKTSVLTGSLDRRTASSARRGTGALPAAAGSGAFPGQPLDQTTTMFTITARTDLRPRGDLVSVMGGLLRPSLLMERGGN